MDALTVGEVQVDVAGNALQRDGQSIRVEPKVMTLLCCLAEEAGAVVTRRELLDRVWAGQVVEDDALSSAMIKLRKALGDSSRRPRFVETVPRRGYRMIAPVGRGGTRTAAMDVATQVARLPPGIAVLPFANLSPDAEQGYFADGLAEDIITALSRVRTFPVISRVSSFALDDLGDDPSAAGRVLGARYVLTGSVRRSGTDLRVTAQLVDAVSGEQVWAERFDRNAVDVFAVQDDITSRVVGALEPELNFVERRRLRPLPPDSLDAWGHYQRGLGHMYRRTPEHDALAEQAFRRAIAMAPGFAAPHAALAYALAQVIYQNPSDNVREERGREACEVAETAIELDPGNATAYCALGRALRLRGQFERSVEASRRAVQLNPSSATCARVLGFAYLHAGDPDAAIHELERALVLSPRDPEIWSFCHGIAMAYVAKREFDEALRWTDRAALAPNPAPWSFVTRAVCLVHLGRDAEANDALEIARRRMPDFGALSQRRFDRRSRSDYFSITRNTFGRIAASRRARVRPDPGA